MSAEGGTSCGAVKPQPLRAVQVQLQMSQEALRRSEERLRAALRDRQDSRRAA